MANRDADVEVEKYQFDANYQATELAKLVALVNSLKTELNLLMTEFQNHDHTATNTYVTATVRINVAKNTVVNTTATHTFTTAAVSAAVPTRWY